ncbi:leucine-rich repeat-containing protein let-4-like isoform X2 [Macrobrachium rosenbergii]|uniref:leucine-rich repeat-containing protein let-4-like isoform X2 n=1 Tax=Macrobrachium rosenbergii TaxID=79674 RepID=UPI0034D40F7E
MVRFSCTAAASLMTLIVKISLSVLAVIVFQRVAAVLHGSSEDDDLLRELEKSGPRNWGKIKSFNTGGGQDAVEILIGGEINEEMKLIPSEENDEEHPESSEEEFLLELWWTLREDYGTDPHRLTLFTSDEIEEDLTHAGGRASEKMSTEDKLTQILKPSNQDGCVPGQLIWPCSCSTSGEGDVSITCRNAQGPDLIHKALIPNYPRPNLQILNIAKSNVGRLPKDILHGKTFEEMNLYGSGIRGIEEGAFAGCQDTLRLIRLNSNHLQSFNFSELVNFPLLEMIALSDNQLTSIEGFVGLPTLPLTTLYIGKNLIKSLPSDVFISLENLGVLDLSYNDISFIPQGVFLPLKQLEVIYLQGNKLGHISTGAFWFSTPILRSLDIRKLDARTTDVDMFREDRKYALYIISVAEVMATQMKTINFIRVNVKFNKGTDCKYFDG